MQGLPVRSLVSTSCQHHRGVEFPGGGGHHCIQVVPLAQAAVILRPAVVKSRFSAESLLDNPGRPLDMGLVYIADRRDFHPAHCDHGLQQSGPPVARADKSQSHRLFRLPALQPGKRTCKAQAKSG